MRRLLLLAPALLACTLVHSSAHATLREEPVKLRRVGVAPILRPGETARLSFELVAARPATIAGLEARSTSLATPFLRRVAPARVAPSQPMRLDLDLLPSEQPDPLVIRYEVDGVLVERRIDLRPLLESERERSSAMVQISTTIDPRRPEAELRPRPERPLPAGDDDPGILPLQPESKSPAWTYPVQVTGQLKYVREDGVAIGVDRIWVRVMQRKSFPYSDVTLTSGFSDNQGRFIQSYQWDDAGGNYPDVYIKFETESPEVTVQSSGLEIDYSWKTPIQTDFQGQYLHLGTWMPADQSTHGALHLHTNIQHNWDWYWYQQSYALESVDVQWPEDDDGAYYTNFWEEIHIGPDRTWRDDTHAHEFGHHWMNNYTSMPSPSYCNGFCDVPGGACGHCIWCPETDHDALSEGWPNWIAHVQTSSYLGTYGVAAYYTRNQESVAICDVTGTYQDPLLTEGFIGAILQDIWDSNNETDPNGLGQPDVLTLGTEEIFEVMDLDQSQTPVEFMFDFRARFPQHTVQLWQAGHNNRLQMDVQPPTAPTNLVSTSHTPGIASLIAQVILQWSPSTDDWSGIAGYDLLIDHPTLPDVVYPLTASTLAGTGYLTPATYMLGIRSRDRAGRVSAYVMSGPYVIQAPILQNMAFAHPIGWARPVVPRQDNAATTTQVLKATSLIGDSPTTYLNAAFTNNGQTEPVIIPSYNVFCVDNSCTYAGLNGSPSPGVEIRRINQGPITVRGGRHIVGMYLDRFAGWPESNEYDNTWAQPWIFRPATLVANTSTRRASPPGTTDGWQMVTNGTPFMANCDGMRMNTPSGWNAASLAADTDTSDFDLRLHFSTSSVDTGFASSRGHSLRGPGELDLVLVNRNVLSNATWDLGITNSYGDRDSSVLRHTTSTPMNYNDSLVVSWPANEFLILRDVSLAGAGLGTAVATGNPADGPFWLAFLDRTFSSGGLSDGAITLQPSDSTGRARILFNATGAGSHAVMVLRDPRWGRGSRNVVLEVEPTPSNPALIAAFGWHSSLVPRAANDGTDTSVPKPDTLFGGGFNTYLNLRAVNTSPAASPFGIGYQARLDGAPLFTSILPALAASQAHMHHGPTPVFVTGGRHTLTAALDHTLLHDELDEADNIGGEQWVWGPAVLTLNTPTQWQTVAPRVGGWSEVRSGEPLFFNSLGLRIPPLPPGTRWANVAMVPGFGNDLDLQLHARGKGTKSGFQAALAVSAWGKEQTDYILYDTSGPMSPSFDIALVNVDSVLQSPNVLFKRAIGRGLGTTGPLTLGPNHSFDLHEVTLAPGNYMVRLLVHSAGADMGVSVHAPTPAIQSKSDALEAAWFNGPGLGEELVFVAASSGTYSIAVWKAARPDLPYSVSYSLQIEPTLVDVETTERPATTRLHFASPNPFAKRMALSFDLATDSEAELEIFDLTGARRATLASGWRAAGRHRIEWGGHAHDGRPLGAGVYFVRLTTPDHSSTTRVVRMP